jgi:stage V sporulation protein K
VLHEIGMRRTATFIETTGQGLVQNGAIKADATIQSAMDGVLFIDEAHSLDPKRNSEGPAIVTKLLKAAEDHRDRITIILAGLVSFFT